MRRVLCVAAGVIVPFLLPASAMAQGYYSYNFIDVAGSGEPNYHYDYPDTVWLSMSGGWGMQNICDPEACSPSGESEWVSAYIQSSDGWNYYDQGYEQWFTIDPYSGASDSGSFYWMDPFVSPPGVLTTVYYYGEMYFSYGGTVAASATMQPNCSANGTRDDLESWYWYYGISPIPSCLDFKSNASSRYFGWGDFNQQISDNPSYQPWGIMSQASMNGVDTTQDYYGLPLRITSGFRSPDTTGGGSYYHMWGRAIDQKAQWMGGGIIAENDFWPLYNDAYAAAAQWVEPYSYNPCNCPSDSRTHVHSQWPYIR